MSRPTAPPWDSAFAECSPIFEPLRGAARPFQESSATWPGLDDYQRVLNALKSPISSANGKPLKIVPQSGRPRDFGQHYAPRVYFAGELQTRTENWHDFFQLLTWIVFPRTKATINARHIPMLEARLAGGADVGRRSPAENMLSLFDEGGAVVLAADKSLLALIREFRWKELFWGRRGELAASLSCVIFGHAVYEKALSPYLGLTANCVLLQVEQALLQRDIECQLRWIDNRLAQLFADEECLRTPHDLAPLPILGLPGWDPVNERETYYDNERYFRPGRAHTGA
ncbi:MAG: hypothetical protein AMJ69_05265 [Gammaproteobacteria bacterium SG8_47]|nr:MAG: hypothetical protein AMJ69_05265 [Gammaproteobacteria bacterium SG8_47]